MPLLPPSPPPPPSLKAFSKSASCRQPQRAASSRGMIVSFQLENMLWLWWNSWQAIWQGAEKITNYQQKFLVGKCGKMCQLCGKQTGLCRKTSTVDKIDNNAFQMYWTTAKQKALESLIHNLSSLIECTFLFICYTLFQDFVQVHFAMLCKKINMT